MTKTENLFDHNGARYIAIARKTCLGCAFEFNDYCIFDADQPYCMASMREDNQDVIWQQEEKHEHG